MDQVTISRELLRQVLDAFETYAKQYPHMWKGYLLDAEQAIRTLLDAPAVEQEPVCDKDPQGCWNVRCQLGKKCKNTAAPQAQQPPRVGSGMSVEQTLEQWEHDFRNPMTPEQQVDWVKREREFAARQAQQPSKAVKLTDEEIEELVAANAGYGNNFNRVARAIEQAVWEKLGVTE